MLTVGGGISDPSVVSGVGENPAGLLYNSNLKAIVHGSLPQTTGFNPTTIGGGIFAGSGVVGGGLQVLGSTSSGSGVTLDGGIGFHIPQIKTAFGVSYGFDIAGGAARGQNLTSGTGDIGILVLPHEVVTFGGTIYSVIGGVDGVGFGLAVKPAQFVSIVGDASYGLTTSGFSIKPGVKVHISFFQAMIGYGLDLNGGGVRIPRGISAGLGFNIGSRIAIQTYYNQLSSVYAGLMFIL